MSTTVTKSARWGDLLPRILSAIVMLAVGGFAVWIGGVWFAGLAVIASSLMAWELSRMTRGEGFDASILVALLTFAVLVLAIFTPASWSLPFLLLPSLIGTLTPRRDILAFAPYALIIVLTAIALILLRQINGLWALVWLISVVVASDVLGYFAGRILGGPKFWPKVSPKKTWSGTVAGWIGAVLVGVIFWRVMGWSADILWISPLIAFAGQLGDIAESAIKRRAGVKDASNMIPGHGGLMDRFDALAFAAVLAIALNLALGFLPDTGGFTDPTPDLPNLTE
ncbi:phosphatidate cytidylyltransferase [Xinfangfangia sp. D13-10-4-6]|uniref:phosphatidate cytidylyltransferase n=1 Tax=Pseudogemmobacter hezensis TaxID=2737662 RepID=UPI001552BDE6|nr:phosphatidate cytidylyltransferase [Pseudogemmobacter hezensis]NPD17538.1 phosphatidate cytidylyltransferase [Pseudogemmobacter hezensis]